MSISKFLAGPSAPRCRHARPRSTIVRILLGSLALLGASLSSPAPSRANLRYCENGSGPARWSGNTGTLKFASQSMASLQVRTQFNMAAQGWNILTGSRWTWSTTMDNDNTVTRNGDGNEVAFESRAPNNTVDAITLGLMASSTCRMIEADIVFYHERQNGTRINWSYDRPPALINTTDVGPNYFQVVASHEIGHALGLDHSWTGMARMESHYPCGGWIPGFNNLPQVDRVRPHGEDAWEMATLYPDTWPSAPILFAANMQDGATSATDDANSKLLSWGWMGNATFPYNLLEPPGPADNYAFPGDTMIFPVCAHNLGAAAGNVPVNAQLAGPAVYNVGDIAVLENFIEYSSQCALGTLTIPDTAPPGSYSISYNVNRQANLGFETGYVNRNIEVVW